MDFVSIASSQESQESRDDEGRRCAVGAYKITRHAVDNETYTVFLNAVDQKGINALALYNPLMDSSPEGGITLNPHRRPGDKYQVKPGRERCPVVYVSWSDAARLANWLSNGGERGSSTEVGAYNLRHSRGHLISRMAGARYAVANADELARAVRYLPIESISPPWKSNAIYELLDLPRAISSAPALTDAEDAGLENADTTFHLVSPQSESEMVYEAGRGGPYPRGSTTEPFGISTFSPVTGPSPSDDFASSSLFPAVSPPPSS